MKQIVSETAILNKKNSLQYLNLNLPNPIRNQVLVKIFYSGVCASQFMEYKLLRGKDKWLPHMFGHEAVGIVERVGNGVKKLRVGEKVILSWINCKKNQKNVSGYLRYKKKKINYGPISTFSNYSLISQDRVYKLPKTIKFKNGFLFGCAIPTGMGIVVNEAKPKKKDICLVVGLGGVGIFSLIALKALKIENVAGVDISQKKINFLKKLGFKNLINIKNINSVRKINKIFKNKKIDFVFDSSGKVKSIEFFFNMLNEKTGKLYFSSHPENGKKLSLDPHELISGKKIFGSWGGSSNLNRDILKFSRLITKSKIKLEKLYKVYPLKKLKKIFENFSKNVEPRCVLKMKH